ncbi:MAG: hypothetical protein C4584_00215 [Armatimonadetes bacterium]|nr:MAG: hypothetical protein C4584_00215 [Armatimonadota bacterium]
MLHEGAEKIAVRIEEAPKQVPEAEERDVSGRQFGSEWRRFRDIATRLITQFRIVEKEHPQVGLKVEEQKMQELAGNFDDLSAKTELMLELTEDEREMVEVMGSIRQDSDFGDEEIVDRSELVGMKQDYEEGLKRKYISGEDKLALKKTVDKRVWGYEPNTLTEEEIAVLIVQIKNKMDVEQDLGKAELYKELYDFIQNNGFIFPEFSDGTSAISLGGIFREGGILQLADIPQGTFHHGEGSKVNPTRTKEKSGIHAGIGRGGLGLAIMYAKREDDPIWRNDYYDNRILAYVSEPDFTKEDELGRDRYASAWVEYGVERHKAYMEAYKKMCADTKNTWQVRGYATEFPIVIGFNRTGRTTVIEGNYMTERERSDYMADEVGFWDEKIDQEYIAAIACVKRGKKNVESLLRYFGRNDVAVISFEALDLLTEFGINEVKDTEVRENDYFMKSSSVNLKVYDLDERLKWYKSTNKGNEADSITELKVA